VEIISNFSLCAKTVRKTRTEKKSNKKRKEKANNHSNFLIATDQDEAGTWAKDMSMCDLDQANV